MSTTAASNITSGPSIYEARATSHPLVQAALARLSNEDYGVLAEFREEFPNLVVEEMAKVANNFMLYRSLYVQKAKEGCPNGNQADYSREAADSWKYCVADSEKARYNKWHFRVKAIWKKMYPNGFPTSVAEKKNKRKNIRVRAKKMEKAAISRRSSRKRFQPLPSPPVSDDADFTERADSEEICNAGSEDDPMDSEYLPRKLSPSTSSRPNQSEESLESAILTPVSMVRELSPDYDSHPFLPMPDLCDSDSFTPAFNDISLFELNGNCPSTFTRLPVFPEQIATGSEYHTERHAALGSWDDINLLSDLEICIPLSPIPSLLCPDLLYLDDFSMST